MSILIPILIVIHVMICLLMVLVVLMQRPRSEGLGAAFGGGMADNLFGAQTTHVLQKFTVWLGGGFFAVTLLLAMLFTRASAGQTKIQSELLAEPLSAPAAPSVEAPPAVPADATSTPTENAVQAVEVIEVQEEPQTDTNAADPASSLPVAPAPATQQ